MDHSNILVVEKIREGQNEPEGHYAMYQVAPGIGPAGMVLEAPELNGPIQRLWQEASELYSGFFAG